MRDAVAQAGRIAEGVGQIVIDRPLAREHLEGLALRAGDAEPPVRDQVKREVDGVLERQQQVKARQVVQVLVGLEPRRIGLNPDAHVREVAPELRHLGSAIAFSTMTRTAVLECPASDGFRASAPAAAAIARGSLESSSMIRS